MKNNIKAILLSFVMLLYIPGSVLAALADSSNHTVLIEETDYYIIYYGTLSFSILDSTSSLFTQAMAMEYLDATRPMTLTVHGNSSAAAQDVNILIEGAEARQDSLFENSYAHPVFDDVDLFSSDGILTGIVNYKQAAADTLAVGSLTRQLIPYPSNIDAACLSQFIRIEADGQTGNRSDVVISWWLKCWKKADAPRNGAAAVFNVTGGL